MKWTSSLIQPLGNGRERLYVFIMVWIMNVLHGRILVNGKCKQDDTSFLVNKQNYRLDDTLLVTNCLILSYKQLFRYIKMFFKIKWTCLPILIVSTYFIFHVPLNQTTDDFELSDSKKNLLWFLVMIVFNWKCVLLVSWTLKH